MSDSGKQVTGNKIVLLGDSGVGKTCLISRFISGQFDANVNSTNGASYASKKVDYPHLGKSLVLDIWDTAGQEKYKSLTKFFYKDAAVAILVYEITKKQTFDNVTKYWHEQLQEFGAKDIIIGVAGNKCDIYDQEEVDENEARQFAEKIGAFFELTSAKNNTGINELFQEAAERYVYKDRKDNKNNNSKEEGEENNNVKLSKNNFKSEPAEKRRKFC